MIERTCYKAFGLVLESEFPLIQLPRIPSQVPDVRIVRADLSGLTPEQRQFSGPEGCYFQGLDRCAHRITGGCLIEVDPGPDYDPALLGLYLMGTCMGAILYQRGVMLLHGSCVTDGCRTVLLTGESGAGKSTLAAEFLRQGWRLITDDVSAVYDPEGTPMVQSSYPSQKLWQDALERYERRGSDIHSLYTASNREKYGVDASEFFYDGRVPLTLVVRLLPDEPDCRIEPITGMTMVDQLMRNTYRFSLIREQDLPRHFQRCVTLSTKISMALVTRTDGADHAQQMYELITVFLDQLPTKGAPSGQGAG